MSLLDSGAVYEDVMVYPQVLITDGDGNPRTQPATVGVAAKARFQVLGQSGTSARRAEQDVEGFESETVYQMRFDRDSDELLGLVGPQSQLVWNGARWAFFGFAKTFNSSRRTKHRYYTIKQH